jgi:hypothetical protein
VHHRSRRPVEGRHGDGEVDTWRAGLDHAGRGGEIRVAPLAENDIRGPGRAAAGAERRGHQRDD